MQNKQPTYSMNLWCKYMTRRVAQASGVIFARHVRVDVCVQRVKRQRDVRDFWLSVALLWRDRRRERESLLMDSHLRDSWGIPKRRTVVTELNDCSVTSVVSSCKAE